MVELVKESEYHKKNRNPFDSYSSAFTKDEILRKIVRILYENSLIAGIVAVVATGRGGNILMIFIGGVSGVFAAVFIKALESKIPEPFILNLV